jgi:hypothetical protein
MFMLDPFLAIPPMALAALILIGRADVDLRLQWPAWSVHLRRTR